MSTSKEQRRLTLNIRPPEKSTLTRQVTGLLTEEIVSQRLPPNKLLPKEHDLAEQLGVSRMVIRESLQMLAALGLIDVRHGVGVYVNPPEAWQVAQPLSLLLRAERKSLMQWLEMRAIFEVGVVRLAAVRASSEDVQKLWATVDRMRTSSDYDDVVLADLDFHLNLAAAAGNPMVGVLAGPLMQPMREHLVTAVRIPGRHEQSVAEHEAIVKSVADHDPEGAVAAMERHLAVVAEEIKTLHMQQDSST